jgi:hypothetical protein
MKRSVCFSVKGGEAGKGITLRFKNQLTEGRRCRYPRHEKKEITMKKRCFVSFLVVVFLWVAFALATAPTVQAAYPEPDKLIDMYHHSSAGGAADLFVRSAADALSKAGIVKSKIQVQTRPGGSSAYRAITSNRRQAIPT